jgi:hypothetical protein
MRKVGNPHSNSPSPAPGSVSGSAALGGPNVKVIGSGGARDTSTLCYDAYQQADPEQGLRGPRGCRRCRKKPFQHELRVHSRPQPNQKVISQGVETTCSLTTLYSSLCSNWLGSHIHGGKSPKGIVPSGCPSHRLERTGSCRSNRSRQPAGPVVVGCATEVPEI